MWEKYEKNNEDNYYIFGKYRRSVKTSVQKVRKCKFAGTALVAVRELKPLGSTGLREEILRQVARMNEAVCRERMLRGGKTMGTTFSALYFAGGNVLCCNVGDSRAYLFRDNRLLQISVDHTEAQQQIDFGFMTEEQARKSRSRHCLTQYIGLFQEELMLVPFFSEMISSRTGDIFLICSDGITDLVTDCELATVFLRNRQAKRYVQELMAMVLQRGAKDNATAVVVCVK